MPPVISPIQNLLSFGQYQPFEVTPRATGMSEATPPQWRRPENLARRLPDAVVATTAALATCTYSNGTSGVGATLTASSNGALGTIDTYASLVNGDVINVKNESDAFRNGLYVITDIGSAGTPWVLTRHTAMDTTDEFVGNSLTLQGSANIRKIFFAPPWPVTVGVTPVTWQASANLWLSGPLPTGMTFHPATGRLVGPVTVVGSGQIELQASADSGSTWSPIVSVVYGIAARPAPAHSGETIIIDTESRNVRFSSGADRLTLILNDDFLTRLRYEKGDQIVDKGTLSSLKIGLREEGEEEEVLLGGGATGDSKSPPWFGSAPGSLERTYLLYCLAEGDRLKEAIEAAALPNGRPYVDLDAEIEWVEVNSTGVGPASIRGTSNPFTVRVYGEIIKNA